MSRAVVMIFWVQHLVSICIQPKYWALSSTYIFFLCVRTVAKHPHMVVGYLVSSAAFACS